MHEEAIEMLAPIFRVVKPEPLPLVFTFGPVGTISQKSDRSLILTLNYEKLNGIVEAENTCVHETGHYLHMQINNSAGHERSSWNERELTAILSTFSFFDELGRLKALKESVLINPKATTEKAVIITLERFNLKANSALHYALHHYDDTYPGRGRQILVDAYATNLRIVEEEKERRK
ncbi:MAG: hypothetical protein KGH94_02365 [Candidatus Micrarchaeota archaeon]|nr:hypothetical protein [Candidatus Micrarchaeota archaeon]